MVHKSVVPHEFTLNGKPYFALTAGDKTKPLMLFLHGFPEYSGAWTGLLPMLCQDYYCVAPDQRGYGRSWRPTDVAPYETRHLVADIGAMIDLFGGGHAACLVGHDWGASVAYATAIRWPDKIGRLVVINGVHPAPFQTALAAGGAQSAASQYINWLRAEGSEQKLAQDDFAQLFSLFSAHMDMRWLSGDTLLGYKAAWRDAQGLRAMVNWYRASPMVVAPVGQPLKASALPQWDPDHLRIRMPHLLIWGLRDTALLAQSRAGLETWCDSLKLVEIADGDHWVVHQQPQKVAAAIAGFLG